MYIILVGTPANAYWNSLILDIICAVQIPSLLGTKPFNTDRVVIITNAFDRVLEAKLHWLWSILVFRID